MFGQLKSIVSADDAGDSESEDGGFSWMNKIPGMDMIKDIVDEKEGSNESGRFDFIPNPMDAMEGLIPDLPDMLFFNKTEQKLEKLQKAIHKHVRTETGGEPEDEPGIFGFMPKAGDLIPDLLTQLSEDGTDGTTKVSSEYGATNVHPTSDESGIPADLQAEEPTVLTEKDNASLITEEIEADMTPQEPVSKEISIVPMSEASQAEASAEAQVPAVEQGTADELIKEGGGVPVLQLMDEGKLAEYMADRPHSERRIQQEMKDIRILGGGLKRINEETTMTLS